MNVCKALKIPGSTERMYIFIPSDRTVGFLPDEVKQRAGDLNFEQEIDIRPGERRIALDTDEAIRDIRRKGFHIVCK